MNLRTGIFLILYLFAASFLYAAGSDISIQSPDNQDSPVYTLQKPSVSGVQGFSGDRQHGDAGQEVRPIRARVVNQRSEPVIGIPVIFEVVNHPAGGGDYRADSRMVPTDSAGLATFNFRLGTAGGEYQIIARIRSSGEENLQLYTLYARESDWLLLMVIGLVGGLTLFLFGIEVMSRGLLRSAGDKMRKILGNLTNNRFRALGLGAFVTMVIQSSSATNVMLVSFVNAGLMRFSQTIGIILGAAIGTTITAQLIAFKLTDFSLLFVAVGFLLHSFTGRESSRSAGESLMGFGILFFGMHIMSDAMYPLRSYEPFIQMVLKLENPLLGILTGALFTALIQSSSAFVGIMIILGMQGLISLEASIPLLFGANIGTAVTALLASIKADREGRKVAVAITLFKVLGVVLFVWWINPFAGIIEVISPEPAPGSDELAGLAAVIPRQIANAHTVYNVFVALLVLPFTGLLAALVDWLMPDRKKEEVQPFNIHYLDESMLKTPVMALSLAKKETIRMGEIVKEMVSSILPVFTVKEPASLKNIEIMEKKVNFLRDQINGYLLKISHTGLRQERVNESFQILYTVKELELIADVVSTQMHQKAKYWLGSGHSFSKEGKLELVKYHEKTFKLIDKAIEVFRDVNIDKALEMKKKYKEYRSISFEFEKQHYERLRAENRDTLMSSNTHLELMAMLRNISSHATNIARILLQWENRP